MRSQLVIRQATEADVATILSFIRGLAKYENLEDQVTATEESLHESLFVRKSAEVLIGDYKGEPVCFALFFHNYSTFLGKHGIYLEDLFVNPEMRGKGFGKSLLVYLAKLAEERGCGRLEWSCLDWNQPSIDFYKGMGAEPMDQWTVYRVTGNALESMASS